MTQTSELSPSDFDMLTRIAGLMIPASDAHDVPGADDPVIMAEVAQGAKRDIATTSAAIATFAAIVAPDDIGKAAIFRRDHAEAAEHLQTLIVQCYYRDDRVMTSLGMEARSPFPKGFEVEQGDWSLLDPVRAMAPLYRPVD